MRHHLLEEKKQFYDWYIQNQDDLESKAKTSDRIAIVFLKKHRSKRSMHTVNKWVLQIRKGQWDGIFEANDLDLIAQSIGENAQVAREAFRPEPVYADQPDFTDPLSTIVDFPSSWAEVNEPYVINGPINLGLGMDFHFPYQDAPAVQAWASELRRREVDGIYLNGDIMDYEKVSSYAKTPDGRYLKDEIDVGRAFLRSLRKMFPSIPIYWKDGNHEYRLARHIADRCPELANVYGLDTPSLLQFDELGIIHIPEQQVAKYGKLWIAHGHELGLKSGTVNIARQVRMRVGVNIIFGHWHKNQTDYSRNLADEVHAAWSIGCLAYLKPRYTGVLNQWTQGGATVRLHEDGQSFTVSPFQIQDGVVI